MLILSKPTRKHSLRSLRHTGARSYRQPPFLQLKVVRVENPGFL